MKRIFLQCTLLLFVLQKSFSQAVTTDSYFPNGDKEITLIFDLKQAKDSRVSGLLGKNSDVFLWSGAGTVDNAFEYQPSGQTNFNIPFEAGRMSSLGNDRWSIKLKPRDYFKVPTGKTIKKLGLLLKSGDGKAQTEDFILNLYDDGLYFKIIEPVPNAIFSKNEDILFKFKFSKANANLTFQAITQVSPIVSYQVSGDSAIISLQKTLQFKTIEGINKITISVQLGNESSTSEFSFIIKPQNTVLNLPPNIKDGINYINDNTVTFSFFAPKKNFVHLIGDFNDWQIDSKYLMNQAPDGERYWLTINNLEKGKEYAFQYLIDGIIAVGDPFCEKILDPKFDSEIPSSTYPNLKQYPTKNTFGGTVSVIQTGQTPYNWKINDFKRPTKDKLVIYELLVRDFNNSRRYREVADSIAYFKRLGINALELMPINEFTANNSWGYNPTYYTAPDKAYGTKNDLKYLIDKCHENGIAVILDVVFNHADYEFPYTKAYWNGSQPSVDSPFQNPTAPHLYSVFYDFNHQSSATQSYFDSVLEFWLKEYKVDGYRFDLSKGFTQKKSLTDAQMAAYDENRIKTLKHFYDKVRSFDKDSYLILEHFADNSEEIELANYGFMLWGNQNGTARNLVKGNNNSLSGLNYKYKGWNEPNLVSYLESHDEERIVYDALNNGRNEVKNLGVVLERTKALAALFFAYPGPKMLWQFGEFGYDVNIDFNGRTGIKPQKWEYLKDENRLKLFKVYAELIKLKTTQVAFSSSDFTESSSGVVKQVGLNHSSMNVRIIANLGIGSESTNINFEKTGKWYDYFSGQEINVNEATPIVNLAAGEFHIFTNVNLPTPETNLVPWQGNFTITANEITPNNSKFQIYPNPTTDKITLKLNGEKTQISLEDIWGKALYQIETKEIEPSIDLSGYTSGMYFIRTTQKGKSRTSKVIKN
ncbi:alpha amylase catalytic region [Emticicia oligotrophica DSM 17448]|uniref:Alpha amylase catalytic region n=1 Tax=Emticicia oligotrophica (strain DSM 17448 / CIP 109782 / MTCC 6937 / GPTSA100-15) TaxID=929562 RepID=A0ABM5N5S8_EMTOG|nr:alpha-amylase family glycosyl hydrolase [Emticicia oligotrophica]AFK04799.1 alpha amylase catalytic region [Emticicia oligotrophica DSM 17448]